MLKKARHVTCIVVVCIGRVWYGSVQDGRTGHLSGRQTDSASWSRGLRVRTFSVIFPCRNCVSPRWRTLSASRLRCRLKPWVTCEIKLFWNNFEIISAFHFTRNHVWNWNKIISAPGRVLEVFQNYFSDIEHVGTYTWAAIILRDNFEIISGKLPRAEITLFKTNVVDKGWNNFEISHAITA